MNSDEIKSLLEEVFFEDEYRISEREYEKYKKKLKRFFIQVYSKKLKHHTTMITIENYVIGTIICDDIWEMVWELPKQNFYIKISKENTISFLEFSKEMLKDIVIINELNKNLLNNMKDMKDNPTKVLRDRKLKDILDV